MFLGSTILTPGQGGIAVVARMTARALLEQGYNLEILSLQDKNPVTIAGKASVTTRGNRLTYLLRCHLATIKHSRAIYDSLGMARAHPRIGHKTRPYAVWMHGIEAWYHLKKEWELALRRAKLVLVNSQYTLDRFQELHWPLENTRVCRLATEADQPPQEFPTFEGPPTVLILSRQDKESYYKGHSELIDCWHKVVRAIPEARLIIAGGGDGLPITRKLVAQSPVASQIDVLGFVTEAELPDIWLRAHVFAMPSRGEGFGLVYAEAMRYGLPVIASIHDAGQEVNQHGVTGFNVDMNHPQELCERIIELLHTPDAIKTQGKAAYSFWFENYRYSSFKERLNKSLTQFIVHGV